MKDCKRINDTLYVLSSVKDIIESEIENDRSYIMTFDHPVTVSSEDWYCQGIIQIIYSFGENDGHDFGDIMFINDVSEDEKDTISFGKLLKLDDLIELDYDESTGILGIETAKVPKFMCVGGIDNSYPKFDIHISDRVYNMLVYINDDEFIEMDYSMSADDVTTTIKHISTIVNYFTFDDPDFLKNLSNHDKMYLHVNLDDKKEFDVEHEYKLTQKGIIIKGVKIEDQRFDDCTINWFAFLLLVANYTWEVTFEKPDVNEE